MRYEGRQSGFGTVSILCIIIILILGGFLIWRTINNQINKSSIQNSSSTNIYKPQSDPNAGYIVIKEWGIRFKPVSGLTGVEYYYPDKIPDMISFTTYDIAKADQNCSPAAGNVVLGALLRSKDPQDNRDGKRHGPINGYYYYSRGPEAACSSRPNKLEGPAVSLLLDSLDSLEAAEPTYLHIKELGVNIKLPSEIADVVYAYQGGNDTDMQQVTLSTKTLSDKSAGCGADGSAPPLGGVRKTKKPELPDGAPLVPNGQTVLKLGDYYIQYVTPQSVCSTDPTVQELVAKQQRAFFEAFKTVELEQ